MLAELLLSSSGTRFYLRSFHKMVLSLSLPSDLFMSKLDASREDVLGSVAGKWWFSLSKVPLSVSQRVAQVTQLRWKDKPGLPVKPDVHPYHFAVDPVWRERDECSTHLCLSWEKAKTLAESSSA